MGALTVPIVQGISFVVPILSARGVATDEELPEPQVNGILGLVKGLAVIRVIDFNAGRPFSI